MKSTIGRIFLVIILAEAILVGFSYLYGHAGLSMLNENLRFLSPKETFDFHMDDENTIADSLLLTYILDTTSDDAIIHRTQISAIGPRKVNLFLTNPVSEGESALDVFFRALAEEKDSTVVRIAHYGDSQLEGDRISCVIRDIIHERFGGSGIGFVPFKDIPAVSYNSSSSGNWSRYTVFHEKYNNNYYGLGGLLFRFGSYAVYQPEDTSGGAGHADSARMQPGSFSSGGVWIRMAQKYAYNSVSLLYGRTNEACVVKYLNNSNGELLATDTLAPAGDAVMVKKELTNAPLNLHLEFVTDKCPDFYGLFLDGPNGVQVDNYSIRGHSGDGLLLIPDEHLGRMLRITNTKLVIFQYGSNIVPYAKNDATCKWMGELYYSLFMKFKKANPEISILVVGSGDMARGGAGGYSSYPNLPKVSAIQKEVALKAGCAYFDLFNMMGGLNSILVWTKKGLAVNNGHFSNKGAGIIASELVDGLMVEYNIYLHKHRNRI